MTQEEKELLLKDLCARLPYGVICNRLGHNKKLLSISPYKVYCLEFDKGEYMPSEYKVEDIKPYLRPMSSMTEEEEKEYDTTFVYYGDCPCYTIETFDFLNKKHFDYRGLISKGLALEAPEGMYKKD